MGKGKDNFTITVKPPKKRDEIAKSLESPLFRLRVEKNEKAYDRKREKQRDKTKDMDHE